METFIHIIILIVNLIGVGFIWYMSNKKINDEVEERQRLERYMKIRKGKKQWIIKQ